MNWSIDSIPNQEGRIVLITGANSGLGFETAKALIQKGATVILGCRSINKAIKARQELSLESNCSNIELLEIDLSDLKAVELAGNQLLEKLPKLDVLINNAGVMAPPLTKSRQGLEIQFAVNHLSHMALTLKLLPLLAKQKGSRVVTISSGAQYFAAMNWNDLQGETRYDRWGSYAQSKLANVMFALELNSRLNKAAINVDSLLAHPGLARTNLQPKSIKANNSWQESLAYKLMGPLFQSSTMGSLPQLLAATYNKAKGGEQYGPRFNFRGAPEICKIAPLALKVQERERLWDISERLIANIVEVNLGKDILR
tara:strand:+ start:367 stop:1305 length:939 start_codon:yes stop_codon:yes gene_type:complete